MADITSSSGPTLPKVIAIAVAALLIIGGGVAALFWYTSVGLQQTVAPPGDPTKFDPVASYSDVAKYAGDGVKLISIEASFVKPDGTMDLKAAYTPGPNTTYEFERLAPPPKNAPPVGAGGSASNTWYEPIEVTVSRPGQMVQYSRIGGGGNVSYQYINLGMQREASDVRSSPSGDEIPDPTCRLADLWQMAIADGAPKDAVADITYDNGGYEFEIRDADFDMTFDNACTPVELNSQNIGAKGAQDAIDEVQNELEFDAAMSQSDSVIAPENFLTEWKDRIWYVAYVTRGKRDAALAAKCYTVDAHEEVKENGSYSAPNSSPAKNLSPIACQPK